jgi:hypothetical protein
VTVRFVSVTDTPQISFSDRSSGTGGSPCRSAAAPCSVTTVNSVLDVFIKVVSGIVCRYRVLRW